MPEFGLLNGLAVRNNRQGEIDDLKYIDSLQKQNEAMLTAKQKMFMDDIEFQNGSNPYDAARIKEESTAAMKQLSDLRNSHPTDWQFNPDVQLQMKQIKQGMKSSPAVLRSIAYKDALGKYNQVFDDAVKHPDKYNLDEVSALRSKIENYNKFGNEGGEDASKTEGAKALIFTPPQELEDLNEMFRKSGDSMNPNVSKVIKNGRDGAYERYVDEGTLRKKAEELYQEKKSQFDYRFTKNGVDPIQAIVDGMKPYIKTEYHIGERNPIADANAIFDHQARVKAALSKQSAGAEVDPYKSVIVDSQYTKTDPKDLASTYGSNVPYFYTDANGKLIKAQGDDFNYDGDIFDKGYNKSGKYKKTGEKVTPGYVFKPLDWAKEQGFLKTKFFGDPEVKPEFEDRIEIVTGPVGKDGDSSTYIKLKAFNEVNANSAEYRLKYNKQFATTKQRDQLGIAESVLEEAQSAPKIGSIQSGYKYIGGDPASQTSWKKI